MGSYILQGLLRNFEAPAAILGLREVTSDSTEIRKPPKKKPGQGRGRRKLDGEVMDIAAVSERYGGSPKFWRSRVARRLVPFRRWGGRIVFVRRELDEFFAEGLEGCTLDEALSELERRSRD